MHRYRKLILEQYLDSFGHMNHASYLVILEEARWDWVHQQGLGYDYIQKQRVGPVVLEIHLRFLREVRWREWVTIGSQLLKWEGKLGHVEQKIWKDDGSIATEAHLKFGLLDLNSRKLITPQGEWLRLFR